MDISGRKEQFSGRSPGLPFFCSVGFEALFDFWLREKWGERKKIVQLDAAEKRKVPRTGGKKATPPFGES